MKWKYLVLFFIFFIVLQCNRSEKENDLEIITNFRTLYYTAKGGYINMYDKPSGKIITNIFKSSFREYDMRLIGIAGDWYKVLYLYDNKGLTGYISKDDVMLSSYEGINMATNDKKFLVYESLAKYGNDVGIEEIRSLFDKGVNTAAGTNFKSDMKNDDMDGKKIYYFSLHSEKEYISIAFFEGVTALSIASALNYLDIVSSLIKEGANVNSKAKNGWTPLMYAADNDNLEIVELLIDSKADINMQNYWGLTALSYASSNGYYDVVKLLIEKGADINLKDTAYGNTALIRAAREGQADIVKLLIDSNAKINTMNNDGKTALDIAKEKDYKDIVQILEEK